MISELLSNPSMIHAAAVHMPIAAAMLGLILIVLSAIFHQNNTLRAVTVLIFAILAVSAWVGIETGEDARDLVPPTAPKAVADQITDHAASAQSVLYSGIVALVLVLISLIRVEFLRKGGLLLAAVAALTCNVFVAKTGHMGGALVYNEGVGTPMSHQSPAPVAPVTEDPAPVEPVMETPVEDSASAEEAPVMETPAPATTPAPVPEEQPEEELVAIRAIDLEEAKAVSFTRDIWPLLDDQCVVCHESPDPDGDYDITTVENMLKAGKKGGPGVVPGKPDESSIILYIRGVYNPRMPEDEDPLSEDDLHMLRMWIAAGAIDDGAAAPVEGEMTDEAPTTEVPVETPAPEESTPAPAEEEMKDEVSASEAPVETPAPEEPTPAPAEEEMKDEAPAVEAPAETPAPEVAPEAAPVEEEMKDEAPATEVPAETPAPEVTPEAAPVEEAVEAAPEATPEAPAPAVESVTEANPANEA